MRNIKIYDRYAARPDDAWIGRRWHATRKAACGIYLVGVIVDVRPGAVRVRWPPSCLEPDSWEPTDRGTLIKPTAGMEGGDLDVDGHGLCRRGCHLSER